LTVSIPLISFMFHNVTQNQLREWDSVNNVLERFNLCEGVTLVARSPDWVTEHQLKEVIEDYFPSMWGTERAVPEVLPPDVEYVIPKRHCRK